MEGKPKSEGVGGLVVSVQDSVTVTVTVTTTTTLVLSHTGMIILFRVINLECLFFCCGEWFEVVRQEK